MEHPDDKSTRAGLAVMIGRSNVGKSTLLNALVGTKIAITTPKPQTTRIPIQGVVTKGSSQVVLVDTPGFISKVNDRLTKKMLKSIKDSLEGVDVIIHVVDPTRAIGEEEHQALNLFELINKPKILVINKIDLPRLPYYGSYLELASMFTDRIDVSARRGTHIGTLIQKIMDLLPEGEFLYPEHQLTDIPNRIWMAELIREKLFLHLRQELPYHTHVEVTELEIRENRVLYIAATIFTTHEKYQRMIIGKKGQSIKEVGQAARKELEVAANRKVFVNLAVSVDPHWMERLL